MPIYEYRCNSCGHEMEAIQKFSESPLQQCPGCNTNNLIKKISAPGFRLKGGGWYETDFKSGKQKNVAGSDNAAPNSSNESGGESGGDSGDKSGKSSDGGQSDGGKSDSGKKDSGKSRDSSSASTDKSSASTSSSSSSSSGSSD